MESFVAVSKELHMADWYLPNKLLFPTGWMEESTQASVILHVPFQEKRPFFTEERGNNQR